MIKMVRYLINLQKPVDVKRFLPLIMFLIPVIRLSGQDDSLKNRRDTLPENFYRLHTTDRNGLVLPEINLKEAIVIGRPSTGKKFPFYRYQRLIYNIKTVYPYALVVRSRLASINAELEKIPD